jgi:hypothetical protein
MPMARFGLNPYGQNLYRIIFAPSRTHLVYGEWPNGERKAQWVKRYPEVGESWVLERWLTPFEYARCTPEEWNQMLTILGPYPERGEYELCHKFDLVNPADESITKLIEVIEQGHKQTRRNGTVFDNPENTQACMRLAQEEQDGISSQMQALIGNALPAFGADAMVGYGGIRSSKGGKVRLSAQEAGLPVMPRANERGKHISRSTLIAGDRLVAQP